MAEHSSTFEIGTINELITRAYREKGSKGFQQFFNFIAKFSHYSFFNRMLVYIQDEKVTFFGSKGYWKKKFRRTIMLGAKPYIILAPKGPVMLVYDVMATAGEDLPETFLEKGLGRKVFAVGGKIRDDLLEKTILRVKAWGIIVDFKEMSFFTGASISKAKQKEPEIFLKTKVTNEANLAALLHELSHLFLGHLGTVQLTKKPIEEGGKIATIDIKARLDLNLSVKEFEAEIISFLISTSLGLIPNSERYLAAYLHEKDETLKKLDYEIIIKTADKIASTFYLK